MRRKWFQLAAVVLLVLMADQATKYLAVSHLTNAFLHFGARSLPDRVVAFYTLKNLDNDPYESGRFDLRRAPVPVIDRCWNHKYVENPGAAWGLLSGLDERLRVPFFHLASLAAIAFLLLFYGRLEPHQRLLAVAVSLVLGGAAGNYTDRLARNYVIDFVDWHWRGKPGWHWPTFNLADSAIVVGVALMLIESFFARRRRAALASGEGAARGTGTSPEGTATAPGGPASGGDGGSHSTAES
jgi:signal peptidase II